MVGELEGVGGFWKRCGCGGFVLHEKGSFVPDVRGERCLGLGSEFFVYCQLLWWVVRSVLVAFLLP